MDSFVPKSNKQRKLQYYQSVKGKEHIRAYHLRRTYGLSITDYNALFAFQYGKCAICSKHQNELKRPLSVDHCHKTGRVRGLVCDICNTKLIYTIEYYSHLIQKIQDYLHG